MVVDKKQWNNNRIVFENIKACLLTLWHMIENDGDAYNFCLDHCASPFNPSLTDLCMSFSNSIAIGHIFAFSHALMVALALF